MSLSINVKSSGGSKYQLDLPNLAETVGAFKVRLAAVSDIPADSQRLIFRGHVLKDVQTFQEIRDKHGLETGQTMHVVRGASAASRATSTAGTQTAPTPPTAAPSGLPNPGMMPPGMPPGMMQNPEQMAALLNSPIMESIMNNPELARSMMMANPQLREVIERNPEVGHVFNDPATFRQMMQLARNPSLMQEMMRNTDRQMANLEMMPGGFDALRRMQEDIQAPLMDAVQNFGGNNTESNNTGTDSTNAGNPFAGLFQNTPSQAPMPNPWAPNNGVPPAAGGTANPTPSGTGAATGTGTANTTRTGSGTTPAATGTAPTGAGTTPAGMPDMASMMAGMTGMGMNNEQMNQMMDSPMFQRMMQLMASDPGMLDVMINSNPQLRQIADSHPQVGQALRNPEFMRTMFNPEMMRSMMQFRQMMGGAAPGAMPGAAPRQAGTAGTDSTTTTGTAGAGTGAGTTPGATGGQDMGSLLAMMNALGGLGGAAGAGGTAGANTQQQELSNEQLEEMYASQLQQLRDMGFLDTNMCLQALRRSNGNVHVAVENLLNQLGG